MRVVKVFATVPADLLFLRETLERVVALVDGDRRSVQPAKVVLYVHDGTGPPPLPPAEADVVVAAVWTRLGGTTSGGDAGAGSWVADDLGTALRRKGVVGRTAGPHVLVYRWTDATFPADYDPREAVRVLDLLDDLGAGDQLASPVSDVADVRSFAATLERDLCGLLDGVLRPPDAVPVPRQPRPAAPRSARVVRVFVSSPGDLGPERDVVKRVIEGIDDFPSYKARFKILHYAYEDLVPGVVGAEPQRVVNAYMLRPEDADIFVCLMWRRMGTPTAGLVDPDTGDLYRSGTEYEFLTAYRARIAAGDDAAPPHVLLYRCERDEYPPGYDPRQDVQVQEFFDRFGPGGDLKGFVKTFSETAGLEAVLRRDVMTVLDASFEPGALAVPVVGPDLPSAAVEPFLPVDLPSDYVPRPDQVERLRKAVLGSAEQIGIVAVAGMGGVGKSVVARALCDDPLVREAFPEGMLWATLGEEADPLRHQRNWIQHLGGDPTRASSVENGKVELRRLLMRRRALLVIDDVWSEEDAAALQAGGTECRVVLTTRDANQVPDAFPVPLGQMNEVEGVALLSRIAGTRAPAPTVAAEIVRRMGNLPLAIAVVAAMLKRGTPWSSIRADLEDADLSRVRAGNRTILQVIQSSVRRLDPELRERYEELVVFPPDEPLDHDSVAALWSATAGMKPHHVEQALRDLRDCALMKSNAEDTEFELHDLQVDYLRGAVSQPRQRSLHRALLESFGPTDGWHRVPAGRQYFWNHAAMHLVMSGEVDGLRQLLTDLSYLQAKIRHRGTEALLRDFRLLPPDDEELHRLASALRLSAPILDGSPGELENQLTGRLGDLAHLHGQDVGPGSGPRFRLRSQTLTTPETAGVKPAAHTGRLNACAVSGDGRITVTAGEDGTLRVWETATGRLVHVLTGHRGAVNCVAVTVDGEHALSGSSDRQLRWWDLRTGECEMQLEGHVEPVTSCAIAPDGHHVVSSADKGRMRWWDIRTGRSRLLLSDSLPGVACVAVHPDGRRVAVGRTSGVAQLVDVARAEVLVSYEGHHGPVVAIAFSGDGARLVTGSHDTTLRMWETESGAELLTFQGHRSRVLCAAFLADDGGLLSGAADYTFARWDLTTGERLFDVRLSRWVNGMAVVPGSGYAAIASGDGNLRVVDVQDGRTVRTMEGNISFVRDCDVSPAGDLALDAPASGTARLWDMATREVVGRLVGHLEPVRGCAVDHEGRLAMTVSDDRTARLWDLSTRRLVRTFTGHTDFVFGCAFGPTGSDRAVSAGFDEVVRVWEVSSGRQVAALEGHTDWIRGVQYSRDGRWILSASTDRTLRLWDAVTLQEAAILAGHTDTVRGCAFSPDSTMVASGSYDGSVRLWDVPSGRAVAVLTGHTSLVFHCVFTPDGRFVLTTSDDKTLRLWSVDTYEEIATWVADCSLECVAVAQDGHSLVVGDGTGSLHFLDLET